MSRYRNLARKIKHQYNLLRTDTVNKHISVYYNTKIRGSEIYVTNDAGFKAIVIGDICQERGEMYLFFSDDRAVRFPTVAEIEQRLICVSKGEALTCEDASYHDWPEYGSLEEQRVYFKEIVERASACQ